MIIDGSGNVGIGIASPDSKLDVVGDVNITGTYKIDGDTIDTDDIEQGTTNLYSQWTTSGTKIYYNGPVDINGNLKANTIDANTLVYAPYVSLNTSLRPDSVGTWLTIKHNTYNPNIGQNYPQPECGVLLANISSGQIFKWNYYMGAVKDRAYTSPSGLRLDFGLALDIPSQDSSSEDNSTWSPYLTIRNDGDVGIGTVDPTAKLDVNGAVKTGALTATTGTFSGNVITGNTLQVGTNTNDDTDKTIYFGGLQGDNFNYLCVIENRVYGGTTSVPEKRELLLFSGNDIVGNYGPDRIRLKGAEILFDTYNVGTN